MLKVQQKVNNFLDKMDLKDPFYKDLPKIELHAHLNGSLSLECLEKLGCSAEDRLQFQKLTQCLSSNEKRLQECFLLFKIAHNATNNKEAVYQATKYVIGEFHNDNVIYLELRTTPRAEANMTKEEYVESVVKGINDATSRIQTKLLLSIDRCHDLKASEESMQLIIKMKEKYPDVIKGVDFCGNPKFGAFSSNLFKQARNHGLFVTLHCAEIQNDAEVKEILNFEPDRIGHGTFIHPKYGGSEESWKIYQEKKIPLESCLTSNVLCGTAKSYKEHHVQEWMKNTLPYTLCTDDKGVFATSMSQELALAAQNFILTHEDLWNMTFNSIEFSFASDEEKNNLKGILEEFKKHL